LTESIVARRGDAVLRHAAERDLPIVDELTVDCYRPIQESYLTMIVVEIYEHVRHEPELTWEQRKIAQNRPAASGVRTRAAATPRTSTWERWRRSRW
jgi:hypothetical protein